MTAKKIFKKNESVIIFTLFLLTLLLSRINIPLLESAGLMPDYFLALFVSLIASCHTNINIFILFLLGICVDLIAGKLLGQYALIFIIIYFTNFILNKNFIFQTQIMLITQHLILATLGLFIFFISSLSYDLNINLTLFGIKFILTWLVCLLYQRLIQYLNNRI